jgi:hypothetical protein
MSHLRPHDRPIVGRSLLVALLVGGGGTTLLFGAGAGCGLDNDLFAGECAPGYSRCGDTCCLGEGDSGHLDGSSDARRDGTRDVVTEDSSTDRSRDVPTQDVPTQDGRPHDGPTSDSCTPPYDTTEHCGSCTTACGATDVCSPVDGGYACVPLCSPPLTDCSGTCVNETNDPDNCGACGKVCPSGFCASSKCQGTTAGDVVLLGHDYHSAASTVTEAKLLSNAAFLPSSNPIHVLSFEHYADPTSVANVKLVLDSAASALGRKIVFTVSTTDTDIPAKLDITSFDELIVYDQEAAAPGVLGPLGSSWASTLSTFTGEGGLVISLDGAAGTTGEMPLFNTDAGLIPISAHTVITKGTPLDMIAPGDAVGHGVVTPYAAEPDSVFFTTSASNGGNVTYVVVDPTDAGQLPVVVHVEVP